VLALVVVTSGLVSLLVGTELAGDGLDPFEVLAVPVLILVFPLPAIRSLRRWDAEHGRSNVGSHA
jgi:hypothetical protein